MKPSNFIDTNVLVYLLSADAAKAERAESLLAAGDCVISVQVLNEFAAVATRKLKMSLAEVSEVLGTIRAVCRVVPLTEDAHVLGLRIAEQYRLSIYDAMIVASALEAQCASLWSEDMQNGLKVERKLAVRNPFVQ